MVLTKEDWANGKEKTHSRRDRLEASTGGCADGTGAAGRGCGSCDRVGGSIRDVQALARHASMATTQLYIEMDSKAQRKLVDLI